MNILDGKSLAKKIEKNLKKEIISFKLKPCLCVILVGDDDASKIYVNIKKKSCENVGIKSILYYLNENVTEEILVRLIKKINNDPLINGILIQLPLPKKINTRKILDLIDKNKDVDGLNSYNLMKILIGQENIIPCTPKGILRLLEEYNILLEGKNICIIGFSDIVGKPLATLCLNRGATVTVCHKKTINLKDHTLNSDIIMTAAGFPNLITEDMVKRDSIIIDIGINNINKKIVGDVDFEKVKFKCKYITPVPGGVGPMTVVALLENTIKLYKIQNEKIRI
jgi:methylenetetrahydrofolate dehydrogenase (NADP+) / methenyltetrahydrofolate cyclohydrolase